MSQAFEDAFHETMLFEVGEHWDPTDPEVIAGLCGTRAQRRKVGYVNIPQDRGGETKYGVAKRANPDIDVYALDLEGAMAVYFRRYWLAGKCDQLNFPISMMHFDGCVNHGIGRANKFLQRAVRVTEDGVIGPVTIAAVNNSAPLDIIKNLSETRTNFYHAIINRDKSQKIFLNGWMRRIDTVTEFALDALDV